MKKLLVVLLLLVAGTVFAQQTQDLGELAKKEKARREELEKQNKKAKVYTADDIDRVKDKLGMETTGGTDETSADTSQASDTSDTAAGTDSTSGTTDDQSTKEQALDQQKQDLQKQIDDLQKEKDDLQQKVDENRENLDNSMGGSLSANPAVNYKAINDSQARIKEIDQKISDLQDQINKLSEDQKKQ